MFVRERNRLRGRPRKGVKRKEASGASIATYLVGARGPEYRRDDVAGTVRWYLYDGLGSVLGEVDPNGSVTSSRKYELYGAVRGGNNPSGSSRHKFVGSLGHPSDDETGLVYMRARYYDPAVGRFTSEDPKRSTYNWFWYCNCNPTNARDFTGCEPWDDPDAFADCDHMRALFNILVGYYGFARVTAWGLVRYLGGGPSWVILRSILAEAADGARQGLNWGCAVRIAAMGVILAGLAFIVYEIIGTYQALDECEKATP